MTEEHYYDAIGCHPHEPLFDFPCSSTYRGFESHLTGINEPEATERVVRYEKNINHWHTRSLQDGVANEITYLGKKIRALESKLGITTSGNSFKGRRFNKWD